MFCRDGFYATELMYIFANLDKRVQPFIFTVRRWAKEFKITKSNFGDNFTNFQFTYMALYFLQNLDEPILPVFDDLIEKSQSKDANKSVKSTFLHGLYEMPFQSKNKSSLTELFIQFLEFYESFDFSNRMISLKTRKVQSKTDPSPLVLENVFVPNASWGHNVSEYECNTLKIMIRETFSELEDCNTQPIDKNQRWGLLELFSNIK